MPRSPGRPALIAQMFDDGDSVDDIAAELDLHPHYVRKVLIKAGRDVPRRTRRAGDDREARSPRGYKVIYDPLGIFERDAFLVSDEVKAGCALGVFAPGLSLYRKQDGLRFTVRGTLDSRQELVRA